MAQRAGMFLERAGMSLSRSRLRRSVDEESLLELMPGLGEGSFAEGEYLPRLNREDERFADDGVRM
jgi:hypothetical protein